MSEIFRNTSLLALIVDDDRLVRNEARLKYGIANYLVKPIHLNELDKILGLRPMELTELAS